MTEPLRVVVDTNTLVSAMLFADSVPGRAVAAILAKGVLLVSADTVTEVVDVIARPKFERYLSLTDRRRFMSALVREAELVDVQRHVVACRDPRDDKFLSLALAGAATAIVTGDADLLALHPFEGCPILSPAVVLADLT